MSRLSLLCVLALCQYGQARSASVRVVDQELLASCRTTYNETFSNDFLLGTWYEVTRFSLFGAQVPSVSCGSYVITAATAEDVKIYQEVYDNPTPSYDDHPVLVDRYEGAFNYLLTGHTQAKEYYLDTRGPVYPATHTVNNFKKINDDYMLVWDCHLRGHVIWLHSRINRPTAAEINAIVSAYTGVPEIKRMNMQRYCA